MSKEKRTNNDA